MKFYRVKVLNDWGSLGYYLKTVDNAAGTHNISAQKKEYELVAGEKVNVKWPDGSITTEKIVGKNRSVSVSDMGYSSMVFTTALFIKTTAKGVKVNIPLAGLMVAKI